MSWSMSAALEEQAAFDYARDTIFKIVDTNPESADETERRLFEVPPGMERSSSIAVSSKYFRVG